MISEPEEKVFVAFEMLSPELADYLKDMNLYERELMVLNHKIEKVCGVE